MTRLVAGVVLCLIAGCSNLSAQTRTRSPEAWEVEFHVGGAFITTPGDGEGSVPRGTRLTNVGLEMWQVPSWYFGDGASLLAQFPLPRTTPLDSVLLGGIARRERSATYGASAARRLTNRLRVEGTVEFSAGAREATASIRAALEASRASFVEYWRRFPTISLAGVTSSVEVREGDLREVLTTGAVSWDLAPIGRVVPYVLGGGGVRWSAGDGSAASVIGSYSTLVLNIRETDSLNIRYVQSSRTAVGVCGGGVRWPVGPRWGIRVDVRDHVSGSGVSTELDATPSSAQDGNASIVVINPGLTAAIRFGNSMAGPPTLSGPVARGARTFEAEGLAHHVTVTAGLTWRF
jgi:hypothetical protein